MSEAIETKPSLNPFDNLLALRLDQSYADTVGVKKLLTTVPVRKPNRQDFVRVNPDPAYRLTPAAIIEVKEDREVYLVTPGSSRRVRDSDPVHHDQPPGHIAPMARQAAQP
jgi:hypothetical protein